MLRDLPAHGSSSASSFMLVEYVGQEGASVRLIWDVVGQYISPGS